MFHFQHTKANPLMPSSSETKHSPTELLVRDNKMSQLISSHDWPTSKLGPIDQWPANLITAVNIILDSRFPMTIFWGPELNVIYNDAYIPILGAKHPSALGKTGIEAWGEIWDTFFPMFEKVRDGEATWSDDQLLLLTRNGYLEECYFTWSYSPLRDEKGQIVGVLAPVTETTRRVLSERRLSASRELGTKTINAKSLDDACSISAEVLSQHNAVIPFACIYIASEDGSKLILKHKSGFKSVESTIPIEVSLTEDSAVANYFKSALEKRIPIKIDAPEQFFGKLPGGAWPESPHLAIATAIAPSKTNSPLGLLMVGINPRRAYDKEYEAFVEFLSSQIAKALAMGKAYEEERARVKELAELDKAKTIFFNNISHEFRTPLALMLGPLADSLTDKDEPLSKRQYEHQVMIQRNAFRLLRLVNTLLDFSRIEAGRTQAIYTPVDLAKLTKEISSLFESLLASAGIQFNLEIEHLSEPVYVDVSMWEKIILNLLSNAFKFTLQGSITVSLSQNKECAVLKIKDTGTGIPEEALPYLFDQFYRVEKSQGRSFEGSGIGLALVKELAKLHDGKISVESELGKGSCFTVLIPLGKLHLPSPQISETVCEKHISFGELYLQEAWQWLSEEASPKEHSESWLSRSSMGETEEQDIKPEKEFIAKRRILLVDDSAGTREYVKKILIKYWSVDIAATGEQAYQLAKQNAYDLILADVMMPNMDGFELIAHLRENIQTKHIPIIMISARAGEASKVEGLSKGADDYLVKTAFSAKELIARVKVHLELGQLRSQLDKKVQERTEALEKTNQQLQDEIKERQNIEKALEESNKKYEFLMSVAPVGIFKLNCEGEFVFVNQQATRIYGLTLDDFRKNAWVGVLHPEDRENVVNDWKNFLSKKDEVNQQTYRIMLPTGEIKWIYSYVKAEYSEGKINEYIATTTDITLVKTLESEKLQALSKAEEQQRLRAQEAEANKCKQSEFIDTLCHEIRNPLNGLAGTIEVLEDKIQTIEGLLSKGSGSNEPGPSLISHIQDLKELVASMNECTVQQASIVNDVLDFSKLEMGKEKLYEGLFKPRKIVDAAIDVYKAQVLKKQLNISISVDPKMMIKGDSDKLKQILLNLLSNAIKFTPSKGSIAITMDCISKEANTVKTFFDIDKENNLKVKFTPEVPSFIQQELRFIVKDTGLGMSQEELAKLFKPYRQANEAIKKAYGGSGLGLSICQKLVNLMGGKIEAQSIKGIGTTFSFTMVCNQPNSADELAFAVSPSPRRLSFFVPSLKEQPKLRIMIVEDNPINQNILKRFLEKHNYEYVIANDGQEAIDFFEPGKFDCIFMDLIMPKVGGLEATRKIREKENALKVSKVVPIIGLSGNAREENMEEGIKSGMNDFVSKPIASATVYSLIEKWSSSQSQIKKY